MTKSSIFRIEKQAKQVTNMKEKAGFVSCYLLGLLFDQEPG
jgi:hypothetical protein